MENISKHFGIFDFWSVFCCGVVCLTSYAVVYEKELLGIDLNKFPLFLYIVIAYVVGLILQVLSSLLVDFGILRLYTSKILETNFKEKKTFNKYYEKYLKTNKFIDIKTKNLGFQRCYNYLKYVGTSYRVDKLHSLYSMMRGISLGYVGLSILTLSDLFIHFIKLNIWQNIFVVMIYALLVMSFYLTTKKYFYRWIEWVFIEFQYAQIEEAAKK